MPTLRYSHVEDLLNRIYGVDMSALTGTDYGENTAKRDELLGLDLSCAEDDIDSYCASNFQPLRTWVDVLSGDGSSQIMLKHAPVFDVLQCTLRYEPVSSSTLIPPSMLRIDKETGYISVKPNLSLAGVMTGGVLTNLFPDGMMNVVIQYRTAFAQTGDNIGMTALAAEECPAVATVTTDATLAHFNLCEPFGPDKTGSLLTTRPMHKMLADGVDDSVNWTMASEYELTCAIAHYSAAKKYQFCYVPSPICNAVVDTAAANVLLHLGTKRGVAGAIGVDAGPFRSRFDVGGQYSGQIKEMREGAKAVLQRYRRAV